MPGIIVHVTKGLLPPRPTEKETIERGLDDRMWGLMSKCWEKRPNKRPDVGEVHRSLETALALRKTSGDFFAQVKVFSNRIFG